MRACLYTPMFLDGVDDQGNSRLDRNIRYVKYYSAIQSEIGFDDIIFADNASSYDSMRAFKDAVGLKYPVQIHKFHQHLARGGTFNMPYVWRALHHIRDLIAEGYQKIICIDSDAFVLTKKLANHIRDTNTGWEALWCAKYGFPEAACHWISEDQFSFFLGYTSVPWERMNNLVMENSLPFTKVNKDFVSDRFGENFCEQTEIMDFYGQSNLKTKLEFR